MENIDRRKLSVEHLAMLEQHDVSQKQLKAIEEVGAVLEQAVISIDKNHDGSEETTKKLGILLMDIRESLKALEGKEDPETVDYAKPVVEAVTKLEKALTKSLQGIDVKPQFNPTIEAPRVNVEAPDLTGVEKILRIDVPKAFKEAIALIPQTEMPEADYSPMVERMDAILEKLSDIDTATRMKPLPDSMSINNLNEVVAELQQANITYDYWQFDASDAAPNYIGFNEDVAASDNDAGWVVYKLTYSGSDVTSVRKKLGSWSNRVAMFS